MESVKNVEKNNLKQFCHDCKKEIEVNGEEIKNGVLLQYKKGEEILTIFKCNDCFKKNKSLTNFRKCEVYSRVVGYLRPVTTWNEGKQQEFKERKEFKAPGRCIGC